VLERKSAGSVKIIVPVLPHISNFDDLDPLDAEPGVEVVRIRTGEALPANADLVLLPGSKATVADLIALRANGWDIDIKAHRRRGGRVLGLCGGYQMLGRQLHDRDGVEGVAGSVEGLGLLDVETGINAEKRLVAVAGRTADGQPFSGYEMHMGETEGPDCRRPFARLDDGTDDGAMSADGLVAGTYVHGLFADDRQRAAWLKRIGGASSDLDYEARVEAALDALGEHLEAHLDIEALLKIAR
jgi:adenosylcobyric acid synthase